MKQPDVTQRESFEEIMQRVLKAMPIEERLEGIKPEQRLAGLDRDQQALALPSEVLRALPEAYILSLAPETQETIRRRLQDDHH